MGDDDDGFFDQTPEKGPERSKHGIAQQNEIHVRRKKQETDQGRCQKERQNPFSPAVGDHRGREDATEGAG